MTDNKETGASTPVTNPADTATQTVQSKAAAESSAPEPNKAESMHAEPPQATPARVPGQPPTPKAVGASKLLVLFVVITFLMASAGLAGAGWLWRQQQLVQQQHYEQVQGIRHDVMLAEQKRTDLVSQVSGLTAALAEQSRAARQLAQQEGQLRSRLTYIEQQLVDLTGRQRIDWILKEVEHFVLLAERRLSLLGDVDGALALLVEADQMVREMGEPSARELREVLINDIGKLRQASSDKVDIDGIFLRLQSVAKNIPFLERDALAFRIKMEEKSALDEDVPKSGWPYFSHRLKEFVNSMVVVQRVPRRRITPLLLTDQQVYLQQTLVILLDQAQLALLRGDTAIYQNSVKGAATRISEYLRVDADRTAALIAELNALAEISIQTAIPKIPDSVRAVQVFRDYWQAEKIERQAVRAAMKEREVEQREAELRATEIRASEARDLEQRAVEAAEAEQ